MATSMCATVAENYVRGQQESDLPVIVKAIHTSEIKILDLVENLGQYLTSEDTSTRCRGTRLLSEVLNRLPRDFLNTEEARVLITFYCDRLKDHYSVTPHSLLGLLALSNCANFPKGSEVSMVQAIFKEVHVQSMIQIDRRSVYTIFANFLDFRLDDLKTLGRDFVFGYIQAMDGEKDPRNLTIVFRCIPIIIQNFPVDIFIEELFEVVSCYFPIDFTPPSNDPYGVTREELILALRKCLASIPKFAEFCLPLIMEKLSSDIQSAKVDCFQTLAACSEVYGAEALQDYLPALWTTIRQETYQAFDEDFEQAVLNCLCAIVRTLSNTITDASKSSGPLDEFLDTMLKDCNRHLQEPELKLMWPTGKLLEAAARASDPACCKIINSVLPLMIEQFHKHTQTGQRVTILSISLEFIKVCKDFSFTEDTPSPVLPYKDSLVTIFLSLLSNSESSLRCIGMSGLVGLMSVTGLLTDTEINVVAEHLSNIVLCDQDSKVRKEAVSAMAFMSFEFPAVIKNKSLPLLVKQLKSETSDQGDVVSSSQTTPEFLLSVLAGISTHPDIVETTVQAMLEYLLQLNQGHLGVAVNCLNCINSVVNANVGNSECLQMFHSVILPQILRATVEQSLLEKNEKSILCEDEIVNSIASLCRSISKVLDDRIASALVEDIVSLYLEGNMTKFNLKESGRKFQPLEVSSPCQQSQLVTILTSIVSCVRSSVSIPKVSILLDKLLALSLNSAHQPIYVTSAKCFACIVNKFANGQELDQILEKSSESSWKLLQDEISDQNSSHRHQALTFWLWLTKSLVLRAHPKSTDLSTKLITMFEDTQLGQIAADGFYIILSESIDVLNKETHADIKLMYRQRFFMQTLPRIVQGFDKANTETKPHYLSALSHLLQFIPKQVLLSELPPLMPMLLQSLHCDQSSLYISTSETFYSLILDAPAIISQEVDSLLPQLLRLCSYQQSMKVRIVALKCVGVMTTLPHHAVYPHQKNVLRQLAVALDDKKRLVRKEAVVAREEWFLLGTSKK
ncbi:MMS19 nucleotide excision repair protein homolog isoform X2 [Ptychodera flava]|uniref:MMS19 nucleotide excision repair protein homolog isoform X2 n=2 Tax=Ptychodera flava TaxID=63121 RepID=UPI00396A051F